MLTNQYRRPAGNLYRFLDKLMMYRENRVDIFPLQKDDQVFILSGKQKHEI